MELQPKTGIQLNLNGKPILDYGTQPLKDKGVINGCRAGIYQTSLGEIEICLEKRQDNSGGLVEEIVIDCTKSTTLQGTRGRTKRAIQVNAYGGGVQAISKTDILTAQLEGRSKPKPTPGHWVKEEREWWTMGDRRRRPIWVLCTLCATGYNHIKH